MFESIQLTSLSRLSANLSRKSPVKSLPPRQYFLYIVESASQHLVQALKMLSLLAAMKGCRKRNAGTVIGLICSGTSQLASNSEQIPLVGTIHIFRSRDIFWEVL